MWEGEWLAVGCRGSRAATPDIAEHASYIAAPSPSSLAAHIQLAEHLTSPRSVTAAHTRLVSDSETARRAIAAGESRPLIGCSPTAVAAPVTPVCDCAIRPTSARGVWNGPTHLPTARRGGYVSQQRGGVRAGCSALEGGARGARLVDSSTLRLGTAAGRSSQ